MKRVMCSMTKGAGFLWLVLLVAGCVTVGPDYQRPEVAVEPDWLETEGACCGNY